VALLPANMGEALWIGGAGGKNHYNIGIGGPGGGTDHEDYSQAQIEDGFEQDPEFCLNAEGDAQFRMFVENGRTSSGTKYARSELREFQPNGTDRATWNSGSGTHYVKGRSRIDTAPSAKPWVVFFQCHDAESDLARVQLENGSIVCRRTPPGGDEIRTVLRTGYSFGTWVDWEMRFVSGRMTIILDGSTVMDVTGMGTSGCYFKTGCYNQVSSASDGGGATPGEYCQVTMQRGSLETWHTGYATPTTPVFTGGSDPGGGPGGGDGTDDVQAPSVPQGGAAVRGDEELDLSWTASSDNVGVTQYNIYRLDVASGGGGSGGGTTATVGKTTSGTDTTVSSADKMVASRAVADAGGVLTEGRARAWLDSSGSTSSRMLVYADDAGDPGDLLATSDQISISTTSESERTYLFTGSAQISIGAGEAYWIAVAWDDPGTPSVTYSRGATSSARTERSDITYGTFPDPFGTPTGTFTGPIDAWLITVSDGTSADQDTAAGRYGWGAPLSSSDEFDYTGAPDSGKWSVYDGVGHDGNGVRDDARVTVAGGKMILTGLAGSANTAGLAHDLDQQYGRWEVRCRSFYTSSPGTPGTLSGGYHPVLIVWPTSDEWPEDGEYDFLENGEPGEATAGAFMHYPSTDSDDQIDVPNYTVDLREFHNFAFEWTSDHVKGFVDGEPWFEYSGTTEGSPSGAAQDIQAMPSGHLTVQLDAFQPTGCLASTMEVEWARVYTLTPSGVGGGGGATTATVGKTSDGASSTASSTDKIVLSSFTAAASGTLTAGHARAWLSSAGSTETRVVVYADASGTPGDLLATSDEEIISNTSEAEIDYTFTGGEQIAISSGVTYWIGLAWDDPGTPSLTYSRDSTAGQRLESLSFTYPTMPDPFVPAASTFSGPIDVYLDVSATEAGSGEYVLVDTSATPSFTDTGLTNGVEYSYRISAEDAAGNESGLSDVITGVPGQPDSVAPSVPTDLVATPGDGRVTLTWTESIDTDSGMLRYLIYVDGSQAAQVAADSNTATALVLVGLTNGVELDFTVSAVDRSLNESAQSAAASATPAAPTVDGVPLLPQRLDGAKVEVAIAWGADLTADEDTWTWTDITEYVRFDPGVSTALGRNDEASTSNPATLSLVLDNSDHEFSLGGRSPNWPNVRRGTPVRVRVDPGGGGGGRVVLQGNADGFTPGWDALTGQIPVVTLSVSGALRRLAQGSAPIQGSYRRVMAALDSIVAYWPLEEGKAATYAPALRGGGDFVLTGEPDWDSDDEFDCSAPLPAIGTGRFVADVDTYTVSASQQQLRFLLHIPDDGLTDGTVLAHISMTGTIHRWDLTYQVNLGVPVLGLYRYNESDGSLNESSLIAFTGLNGFAGRVSLAWTQSGANIIWQLSLTRAEYGAVAEFVGATTTGRTAGIVEQIDINPHSADIDASIGHVTVENTITDLFAEADSLIAHEGDFPTSSNGRLARLCTENQVPLQRFSTGATLGDLERMGPQRIAPLLDLLRECEASDQGMLWDGRNAGLCYTTRRRRELGAVALTVDAAAGELAEGFEPRDDDQRTRNKMTVTRLNGVTVTREDSTGPMGTGAGGIGIYDDSATINNRNDSMARQYALWFVAHGTVEGYRYPSVTVDLAASPHLAAAVLDVLPGERIDVTNLDTTLAGFPDDAVSLVVEGIAHEITTRAWRATFRCSLFEPWAVGEVAAESGDTSDMLLRLDTDGSTVNTTASASATSLSVASSGELWTVDADDYPLYLSVGGIKVRATACSGGSSPQTMTVDALPAARAAGLPIMLWEPRRIGLG
jgi:hypothetical protein